MSTKEDHLTDVFSDNKLQFIDKEDSKILKNPKYFYQKLVTDIYPQIQGAERILNRLLWILAYLFVTALFVKQTTPLFKKYLNRETTTNIEITSSTRTSFPTVTVCSMMMLKLTNVQYKVDFGSLGLVDIAQMYEVQKKLFPMKTCDFSFSKENHSFFEMIPCSETPKICIPNFMQCDGIPDCPNNEDESECDRAYDDYYDIYEGEDEWPYCESGTVECPEDDLCILDEAVCNGKLECKSGWDEDPQIHGEIGKCADRVCTSSFVISETNQSHLLTLPHSPKQQYLSYLNCSWTFRLEAEVTDKNAVTIRCTDCLVEEQHSSKCEYDYFVIQFRDISKVYCPNVVDKNSNLYIDLVNLQKGDVFTIRFISDSVIEGIAQKINVTLEEIPLADNSSSVVISANDQMPVKRSTNDELMVSSKKEKKTSVKMRRQHINRKRRSISEPLSAGYYNYNGNLGKYEMSPDIILGEWRKLIALSDLEDKSDIKVLSLFYKEQLTDLGLPATDMIVGCSFDQKKCKSEDFTPNTNAFDGTCYTFNNLGNDDGLERKTSRTGSGWAKVNTILE